MANNPHALTGLSPRVIYVPGSGDVTIGGRWESLIDPQIVLTVLENRGPTWDRKVLWKDQRGHQGITSVQQFKKSFTYIPTEEELRELAVSQVAEIKRNRSKLIRQKAA